MCRKAGWHRIEQCQDTDEIEARRFNRLKSDLFNTREFELPTAQKRSMTRNSSLPFLRLPPEIRLRIYALVLGRQTLWIGHAPEEHRWNYVGRPAGKPYFSTKMEKFHRGGALYHVKGAYYADLTLDLRPLRTCRHVYMETALLPYSLNRFVFQDDAVRRRFEKSARVGKKRAQRQAVGKYDFMLRSEFEAEEWRRGGFV